MTQNSSQTFTFLWTCLAILLLNNCSSQKQENSEVEPAHNLPSDLLYQGKPISNACMEALIPIFGRDENPSIDLDELAHQEKKGILKDPNINAEYQWEYIGTLAHGDHLIYGYSWPEDAMGKFTCIATVRRTENQLRVIGYIAGGDRHSTMIQNNWLLEGDQLTYHRCMTSGSLYEEIMRQYPELAQHAAHKSKRNLLWGEADYLGDGEFKVTISPEGTIVHHRLISFTIAEGEVSLSEEGERNQSLNNLFKDTPKASLAMGDALIDVLYFNISKNNIATLHASQLKEMMIEVFAYTAEEHAQAT